MFVVKHIFASAKKQFKKNKQKKKAPLVSAKHDVALLRRVHKKKFPTLNQYMHMTRLLGKNERLIFRLSWVLLVVGFVWFGTALAQTYRTSVPAVGGRYVEAIVGTPERVNPLFASLNDVDMDIARLVYSGLMRVDGKQRIVPDLAATYEISEDKKTYTFNLRRDVVWHDGEPFTAQDVVYTIETIQNEDIGSPLRISFEGVGVTAVDEYTVQFVLPEPFGPFLSTLTVGILPEHIWFDLPPERILVTQKNLQPVGTGPFRFAKLVKDESGRIAAYELERFEEYYKQPPYIKDFVLQFFDTYDGDGSAITALRQQSVDALHFVPNDLKDKVLRKNINLHTLQLPEYTALFLNQNRQPALEDANVRAALAYALDKERILRETLDGEGQVIYSPILPGFPGYNPEIERTPYNVEEANTLLDKTWSRISSEEYRKERKQHLLDDYFTSNLATSTDETTSSTVPEDIEKNIEAQLDAELNNAQTFYRKNEAGELLEIKLVTTDTQEYQHAAERVAGFWQELGVHTQLSYVPAKELSRNVLKGRLYDVLLYGVIVGSDPDLYPFWHSSQIDFPGLNLSQYINRSADELLEKARETSSDEEQVTAYQEFQTLLLKDRPAIFLYMPTYTYATTDKVKGQELSRIFSPSDRFADVIHWYIKTEGKWQFNK